jgi:hypothetical protein
MGHFNESPIELDNDEKKNKSFKDIPVILRKDVQIIGKLVFFSLEKHRSPPLYSLLPIRAKSTLFKCGS